MVFSLCPICRGVNEIACTCSCGEILHWRWLVLVWWVDFQSLSFSFTLQLYSSSLTIFKCYVTLSDEFQTSRPPNSRRPKIGEDTRKYMFYAFFFEPILFYIKPSYRVSHFNCFSCLAYEPLSTYEHLWISDIFFTFFVKRKCNWILAEGDVWIIYRATFVLRETNLLFWICFSFL